MTEHDAHPAGAAEAERAEAERGAGAAEPDAAGRAALDAASTPAAAGSPAEAAAPGQLTIPTLRDVAILAGVSTATASNALTGGRPVGARSREAVIAAAAELGYRSNRTASALRTGLTHAIGLVVPDVTNPFYAEMVKDIEDIARELGWSTTLCNSGFDAGREQEYLASVAATCDGLLLFSTQPSESTVASLVAQGFPVVTCDEPLDVTGAGAVRSDNAGGARAAALHLVDSGARSIALIAGPQTLPSADERIAGFVAGLAERGRDLPAEWVVRAPYGMDGGRAGMWDLLTVAPEIDAVFASTDMQAIGAVFGAFQAGRSVPDDLLICGFDGIEWTARMYPTVTTIRQDRAAMARTAVEMLVGMIRGGQPEHVVLPTELVVRASTTAPASPPATPTPPPAAPAPTS